jgi:hypothetical protein
LQNSEDTMFHQIIGETNVVNYWILVLQWGTGLKQEALGWIFDKFCIFFLFNFKQRISKQINNSTNKLPLNLKKYLWYLIYIIHYTFFISWCKIENIVKSNFNKNEIKLRCK